MVTEALTITKGDTWPNTLPITQRDGTPYDLTGATVWLTIKDRNDNTDADANAIIQLGVGSGLTVSAPATGVVAVELTDAQTGALLVGPKYKYDVQVRKGGKTFTPIGGLITVERDTTRS